VATLTPAEREAWAAATATVEKQWVDNLEKRGLPGKRVLEEYKKYMASLKKKKGGFRTAISAPRRTPPVRRGCSPVLN
jgi:hypothetical protein